MWRPGPFLYHHRSTVSLAYLLLPKMMNTVLFRSLLFVAFTAQILGQGSCSAPWRYLGRPSFYEGELGNFARGTGIYSVASWAMPKNFFRSDWDPNLVKYNNGELTLTVEKRPGGRLMGGEIRTNSHVGYGCLSACMKPIKESGIISSLFTYTGFHDGYRGIRAKHNEIDVEFEGKNTNFVQFNYYTNNTQNNQNNEFDYNLGFDASKSFNVYGFRWTPYGIEWEVNGKIVYTVGRDARVKPPLATSDGLQKVMANAWVVAPDIQQFFGGVFNAGAFTRKTAEYKWIRYQKLGTYGRCNIAPNC